MKKVSTFFTALALAIVIGQAYNFHADPSAEPRPFGFGEAAGKSAEATAFTLPGYPGQSEVVGAKG